MATWCHVKFVGDNSTVNLPTSHIKEVVENVLSPSELKERHFYSVFWSPDSRETPMSLKKQGNEIIDIDDLPEKERERRMKRNGGPLAGYYRAMLLDLRSSEDSFQAGSNPITSAPKRVVIPTAKALESTQNPGPSGMKPRSAKLIKKRAASQASKLNIQKLMEGFKHTESTTESEDTPDSSASSSEGDSSHEKDSVEYWKKKVEEMKAKKHSKKKSKKRKSSKDKVKQSKSQQKKGMVASSQKLKERARDEIKPKSAASTSSPLTKSGTSTTVKDSLATKKDSLANENDSLATEEHSPTTENDSKAPDDKKEESPDEDEVFSGAAKERKVMRGPSDPEESSDEDEGFSLAVKKRRVKRGPAGDSLFVMNEALRTWGHEALAVRCPTGVAQIRKGSKNKLGYPKMTPEKVNAIGAKLHERIVAEGASKKELKFRKAKLQYYLGQRVSSSRRSLRLKGIYIPSPEEVQAQKQSSEDRPNPDEDGGTQKDEVKEAPRESLENLAAEEMSDASAHS